MFDTRMVAATSATVSSRSPACRPTHPLCDRLATSHLHRSLREIPVDVRLADPVVLPHADRRQLTALDQPVHGHIRDPHRGGDLAHREEPVTDERPPFAHLAHPSHLPHVPLFHICLIRPIRSAGLRTVTSATSVVNHPIRPLLPR